MIASADAPLPATERRAALTALGIVLLLAIAVFAPAIAGDYVDDDLDLLAHSPAFRGIAHAWDAVRTPFWGGDLGYWRPLTSAVMCLGHALGDGHPWLTHVLVLLAHLTSTVLAFAVLRRLGATVSAAALAAAFVAVHPCQVESVAWVAAAGDVLAGCATLLALHGWVVWRTSPRRRLPWMAWCGFALALASKESGVTALGWLAAAELALRLPRPPHWWRGALGLLVVLAAWVALRCLVFGDVGAGFDRGALDLSADQTHPLALRLYVGTALAMLPTGWLGATPYRWIPPTNAELVAGVWPLLLLAAGFVAAVVSAARAAHVPHAADAANAANPASVPSVPSAPSAGLRVRGGPIAAVLGGLGVAVAIAPPALLPRSLGPWPLCDRYVYVVVFGFAAVLLGSGRCRLALALPLVASCAVISAALVPQWRTHEAVVERARRDCPQHPETSFLRGGLERMQAEGLPLATYDHAVRAAHHHCLAERAYRDTLLLLDRPLYASAFLQGELRRNAALGAAVCGLKGGGATATSARLELSALAARWPEWAPVQLALGLAFVAEGDLRGADAAWQRALELDASSDQAAFNLGRLYARLRRPREARMWLQHALLLNPRNASASELLARLPR